VHDSDIVTAYKETSVRESLSNLEVTHILEDEDEITWHLLNGANVSDLG